MQPGKLKIEEPCPVSWQGMKTCSDGRWCDSCSKLVVDFTKMTDAEVFAYLGKRKDENVCGRYRADQLETTAKPFFKMRWLATAIAFVFGMSLLSSCWRHVQGCAAYQESPKEKKKHHSVETVKSDSTQVK